MQMLSTHLKARTTQSLWLLLFLFVLQTACAPSPATTATPCSDSIDHVATAEAISEQSIDEAIAAYSCAIEVEQDLVNAHFKRGRLYAQNGQHERAIEDFSIAISLRPNSSSTYFNRAVSLAELRRYGEAVTDLREAIRLNPDDDSAYLFLGIVYRRMGDHDAAIEILNEAINLSPENPLGYGEFMMYPENRTVK